MFKIKNVNNNEIYVVLEINFTDKRDVLLYNYSSKQFEIITANDFKNDLLGGIKGEQPIYEYVENN